MQKGVVIAYKKEIAKTNVLAIDAISIVFLLLYDSHFLNHYILQGAIATVGFYLLNSIDYFDAFEHFAKHGVSAIQMRRSES